MFNSQRVVVIYNFIAGFFRVSFRVSLGFQFKVSFEVSFRLPLSFHASVSYQDFFHGFKKKCGPLGLL